MYMSVCVCVSVLPIVLVSIARGGVLAAFGVDAPIALARIVVGFIAGIFPEEFGDNFLRLLERVGDRIRVDTAAADTNTRLAAALSERIAVT